MITKKVKKSISILALSLLLSGAMFSGVSAKDNSVATTDSIKKGPVLKLGGGDSPSAGWTKGTSQYQNFNRSQLSKLNQMYNSTVMSSSYNRGKYIYNASLYIAGILTGSLAGTVGTIAGAGTSYLGTFCDSYYSLIQDTANTVNQAYYRCSANGTEALYVTRYYRPASGESILVLSWY